MTGPPQVRERSPPPFLRAPPLPMSFAPSSASTPSYAPSAAPSTAAATPAASVPFVWQPMPMGSGLRWPQVRESLLDQIDCFQDALRSFMPYLHGLCKTWTIVLLCADSLEALQASASRQSPPRQAPAPAAAAPPAPAPPAQYARVMTPMRQLPHTPRTTPFSFQWQPSHTQLPQVSALGFSSPHLVTPRRVAISPAPCRPISQEQQALRSPAMRSYRQAAQAQAVPARPTEKQVERPKVERPQQEEHRERPC